MISHLHADHFLDLVPFSYALTYAPRQQPVPVHRWPGTDNPARPRLIAPPGATETFRRVVGAWGNDDLIENAFAIEEYAADDTPEVGPLRFSFQPVPHFTETFAIRIESNNGGGELAYGADSRPSDELVEFVARRRPARWSRRRCRAPSARQRGHLTPARGRRARRKARASSASCSRTSPTSSAALWARERGEPRPSAAPVDVAREGAVYTALSSAAVA